MRKRIDIIAMPMANAMTISGRTLTPFVSSSKNLRSPALEAGIGACFFFLLLLKGISPS